MAYVGTIISLELNQVQVDYGKNHSWTSHAWLFPPGSDQEVPYVYDHDVVEIRPGLSAPLEQVRFRLDHLGYSLAETRDLYNAELERWNRTYALRLPFEHLLAAVTSIDFAALTQRDQEDFEYEFPVLLLRILESTDPQDDDYDDEDAGSSEIEDFVRERIPVHVLVRCLAERSDNLGLPLTWCYQDLVENGWEDRFTLMEIDRTQSTLNLIRLYGRLQDQAGCYSIAALDQWLASRGVPCDTPYIEQKASGTKPKTLTLPSAVRNMIHHPENRNQILTDAQLELAIELLLRVVSTVNRATG